MDDLLRHRLNQLTEQSERLKQSEGMYRLQEAKRKTMEADLFLTISEAGNVAEKQARVHAHKEYIEFMESLAKFETQYNSDRRRYEIFLNAYFGELAGYKKEMDLIKHEK